MKLTRMLGLMSMAWMAAGVLPGCGLLDRRPDKISCGPYLTHAGQTTMSVRWTSDQHAEGVVTFRHPDGALRAVSATAAPLRYPAEPDDRDKPLADLSPEQIRTAYLYEAKLEGLTPDTRYKYTVEFGGETVESSFRTLTDDADAFTFVVFGDSQREDVVAGEIAPHQPAFLINTGDLVDHDYYPEYEQYFSPSVDAMTRRFPMAVSRGNHEQDAKVFAWLFGLDHERMYYSFDYGNAHFVCLDSGLWRWPNADENIARMLDWAERDLKQSSARWKIVFFHEPLFDMSYRRGGSWGRDRLMPVLRRTGVDLVMAGHAHNYQRYAPLYTPGENETHPITFITSAGASGAYLAMARVAVPHLAVRKATSHYMVYEIEGDTLRGRAIAVDGRELDRFVIRKIDGRLDRATVARAVPEEPFGALVDALSWLRIPMTADTFEPGDTFEVPIELRAEKKAIEYDMRVAPDCTDVVELVEPARGTVPAEGTAAVSVKLRAKVPIEKAGPRKQLEPQVYLHCHYTAGDLEGVMSTTRIRTYDPEKKKD
ncbi:MAG: metallophosphoesterase [Planctomycetota bacterium]